MRAPANLPDSTSRNIILSDLRASDINLVEKLGFNIKNLKESGWLKCVESIGPHNDLGGICLLCCSSGAGILETDSNYRHISSGFYLTFSDIDMHSFSLLTKTCTIMACLVKNRIPKKDKFSPYKNKFVGFVNP